MRAEHVGAQLALVGRDDRRAELDRRMPARAGAQTSSSKTTPPISTSSPASKPASCERADHADPRAGAHSMCASASSFSRSWRASRRSMPSPSDPVDAVAAALDAEAARVGGAERDVLGELAHVVLERPDGSSGTRAQELAGELARGPRPVAARGDERPARRAEPQRATLAAAARSAASDATRSAFDSASTRGSAAKRRSWRSSSASIVVWLSSGSDPSSGARSSTWTSTRVRSTCARNS